MFGFINKDVHIIQECTGNSDALFKDIGNLWDDLFKADPNVSKKAWRELLHIIERLPVEFKSCDGIRIVVMSLIERIINLALSLDLLIRIPGNALLHGLEIAGKFIDVSADFIN